MKRNVVRSVHPKYEYHLVDITECVWCERCLLPSMMALRYVIVARLDPTKWLGQQLVKACRECGVTTYSQIPR